MASKRAESNEFDSFSGEEASGEDQLELFDLPSRALDTTDRAAPKTAPLVDHRTVENDTDLDELEAAMTAKAKGFALEFRLGALADEVHVVWNTRMRTSAGRAHYHDCRIELNPRLVSIENGATEVERTFLHELAHLVAHHRNRGRKIQPHGREWRQACADVGIPGEGVYHQLPVQGRKIRRQYAYSCPVCGTEFERVRRFRRAVACYDCCRANCGGQYDDRYRLIMRRL